MTEFIVTMKKELEGIIVNENVSFNTANAIFSSMYGGPKIPKNQIEKFLTKYENKMFVRGNDKVAIVYGMIPKRISRKLGEYNLILRRIN